MEKQDRQSQDKRRRSLPQFQENHVRTSTTPMIAICFFGLTRSLSYTIQSIRQHIYQVLHTHGIRYKTYLHTYNKTSITNRRSKEMNCKLHPEEYSLLAPDVYLITNQDDYLESMDPNLFHLIQKQGDAWNDNFMSVRNLLCQLNSLKLVTSLWQNESHQFDAVLYVRPDLLYNGGFCVEKHLHELLSTNTSIMTPNYHTCGGFNDRIALGTPDTMQLYGNRIHFLLEYLKENHHSSLHSETFLKYVVTQKSVLQHSNTLSLWGKRIRANGKIDIKDKTLF